MMMDVCMTDCKCIHIYDLLLAITNVSISIFVNELKDVGDVHQNYELDLTLILEWYDPRILSDQIDLQVSINEESLIQKFWLPDLFIVNAQSISVIQAVNPIQKLTITERGMMHYVRRLDALLQCSINLEKYPHDHNYCDIRFSTSKSFVYSNFLCFEFLLFISSLCVSFQYYTIQVKYSYGLII